MKIYHSLDKPAEVPKPIALSIGFFDGVHTGHVRVLQKLREQAEQANGSAVVITYENHPYEVLQPLNKVSNICTIEHKLALLEENKIDAVILLKFCKELSMKPADDFLEDVRNHFPFFYLNLGHDGKIGKNREGDPKMLQLLSAKYGFKLEYLPPYFENGKAVSSSAIRAHIQKGELQEASKLLGRPYSIYSDVVSGMGQGAKLGFPTANLSTSGLCIPPLGVYAVSLRCGQEWFEGIANLGVAPTIRFDKTPVLETHLFNCQKDFVSQMVEVVLHEYVRPEIKFENPEQLTDQIRRDVEMAQDLLARRSK